MTAFRRRCAIYTRKSTEEGLDQAFNSLDAQREACEAYIKSQRHEGWVTVPTAYDDGGFSGGSMDRPALKALLADIDRGLVDLIVVYKVDRLTRSLTDFSRIIEILEARGASFVSVTQAFNTTTSMGRLTLNVLLSFAQFEREVTSERIRDKIRASKAKGMWMGGRVPFGYSAIDKALQPDEVEARSVVHIFRRYLELGSVTLLQAELERDGFRSKIWTTQKGKVLGNKPFSRGQLYHLLQNRLYRGEIQHGKIFHPGRHPPIVEEDLFEAVRSSLAVQRKDREARFDLSTAILKGLVFDAEGRPMSPAAATGRSGSAYRYYVTNDLLKGKRGLAPGTLRRIAGRPFEELVIDRLRRWADAPDSLSSSLIAEIERIDLHPHQARIKLRPSPLIDVEAAVQRLEVSDLVEGSRRKGWTITILIKPIRRGGRTWITGQIGTQSVSGPQKDPALIKAVRTAHRLLTEAGASPLVPIAKLSKPEALPDSYVRNLARLAFLAPDIQRAILEGRQPAGLTLRQLMRAEIPMSWAEQRRRLGF